jgi:parallel beta-helix repeat protein
VSDNLIVGVYIANSNDKISENSITYNYYGIYFYESANNQVHFNQIFGNYCGLVSASTSHLVNATNNWWGNNTLKVISTDGQADISIQGGNVDHSTWLILTVTPTSYKVANGRIYAATITADLTHNSNGTDISLEGCVPDNIPVYFYSGQNSTISPLQHTLNGKASSQLVLDPNYHDVTLAMARVDNGYNITSVDWIAEAFIYVGSTALDVNTTEPLLFSYEMPLNESVSWVSVLWRETSCSMRRWI